MKWKRLVGPMAWLITATEPAAASPETSCRKGSAASSRKSKTPSMRKMEGFSLSKPASDSLCGNLPRGVLKSERYKKRSSLHESPRRRSPPGTGASRIRKRRSSPRS